MLERLFGRRSERESDESLIAAAMVASQYFSGILRGEYINPEVQRLAQLLEQHGHPTRVLTIKDNKTINLFEERLTTGIVSQVKEVEKELCIGCQHEQKCRTLAYSNRPCAAEGGIRDRRRYVGTDYGPIGILHTVSQELDIPLVAFPFNTGVYVQRGRLIHRNGREQILIPTRKTP